MNVKRKFIKHGDIIEIPLKYSDGFSYLKVIDPQKIENPIDLPFFARIYNSFHQQKIASTEELNRDLLLAPFFLVGFSAAISKYKWSILKNEEVENTEEFIPDTKRSWPPFVENPDKWGFITRFDTHLIFTEYENVKHLDDSTGKHVSVIPFLIELEKLKLEGKDIKNEMGLNDWLEEVTYKNHFHLPTYVNLSEELKGMAIKK